jgi:hypothetical protein
MKSNSGKPPILFNHTSINAGQRKDMPSTLQRPKSTQATHVLELSTAEKRNPDCTLQDLCPEDKEKVARLLKQV